MRRRLRAFRRGPGATSAAETTPSTTTERRRGHTLTATQYRKATNRLCREDEAAAERLANLETREAAARSLRRTLDYARKREPLYAGHEELRRLSDRTERELARLVERIADGGDPFEELQDALPTLAGILEQNNALARRMGTKDCIAEIPTPAAQPRQDVS